MGGLFAVHRGAGTDLRATAERLDASFRAQGFARAAAFGHADWSIMAYPPMVAGEAAHHQDPAGNAIASVGTLFYRGRSGTEALPRLLADLTDDVVEEDELWGTFGVVAGIGGDLIAFTDRPGTLHLYADRSGGIVSSSFLALAEALPDLTVDDTSLYDYLFHEAPHGGGTVFDEIRLLPAEQRVRIGVRPDRRRRPVVRPSSRPDERFEDSVARCLAPLRHRVSLIAGAFGDRIDTALSGGFDSRLILGLLRAREVRPAVHVYGGTDSLDVRIARTIAASEGFPLAHVDKDETPIPSPDDYAEIIERNYRAFDGYPNDGLFDNGSDLATRRDRCADGRLALNGGGGEIFRNFFHLPDRPLSAAAVVKSFYSQYAPGTCRPRFRARAYAADLARRLAGAVGVDAAGMLTRDEVEAVYPDFRCRYWMGRNNTTNTRFGPALTPFIDREVVAAALQVPYRHKQFGRLQARMIQAVDPALAAYPSGYGHAFDQEPPLRARVSELTTLFRPSWLRERSYRLRRRHAPMPPLLTGRYREAVLGSRLEFMDAFIDATRIADPRLLNRVMTLEYLFRRLRPSIRPATS